MTYDELLCCADEAGLVTKEKDLQAHDGRIKGNRIAIRRSIDTRQKKAGILAEELGHYYTSVGSIVDCSTVGARQQERRARLWAFDVQVGLDGLVSAYLAGCRSPHDAAEYLDVPEEFLQDAIRCYREKYGDSEVRYLSYAIVFEPELRIRRIDESTE